MLSATGASQAEVEKSPFLERLLKKGYEVVYFTDVLDEYLMQHLQEFDDRKFASASKEDLKMSDQDDKERKRDKELKEEFKDLTKWWKTLLGEKVATVKVSNRLTTTPCVVVTSKFGNSANMERIMRSQAFGDPSRASFMKGQRSLEVNPRHPLVRALKDKVDADEKAPDAESVGHLLFETALLESGFELDDAKSFSARMYEVLKDQIGYQGSLSDIEPEAEEADEPEAEAEEAVPAADKEAEPISESTEEDFVKEEL
jgi:heat shock protein 90kDa beta